MATERKKQQDRERMQRKRYMQQKEISEWRYLAQVMIDNDPNEVVADTGVTVLELWRDRANDLLLGE